MRRIPRRRLRVVEHTFERLLFRSRWILAPAYLALAFVLLFLIITIGVETVQLASMVFSFDESRTVVQALTVVDVVLVMNLVLMVLFVGYTNFVSVFDFEEFDELAAKEEQFDRKHPTEPEPHGSDIPPWMSHLDYSGLKVQLMGSIIAIAAITTLRVFIELANGRAFDAERIKWTCVIFLVFLAAAMTSAVINWLKHLDNTKHGSIGLGTPTH